MAPHSSTLAWKIPWRSLEGWSPWGRWGSDTTEWLHFHFSLSCTGEGNGNPLQCSCLENPRDGEPGGLPSMGSHRVRQDWSDLAAAAAEHFKRFRNLVNSAAIIWTLTNLGNSFRRPFFFLTCLLHLGSLSDSILNLLLWQRKLSVNHWQSCF